MIKLFGGVEKGKGFDVFVDTNKGNHLKYSIDDGPEDYVGLIYNYHTEHEKITFYEPTTGKIYSWREAVKYVRRLV